MFRKKKTIFIGCLLFAACYLSGCDTRPKQKTPRKVDDYIKPIEGPSEIIPTELARQGEVLIGYSDCYICHKKDERSAGPSFKDIAKRYPANKVYIEMLAQKVIIGGSGNWGSAKMDPHPKLSVEDARMMVSYILSLEE